MSLLNQATKKHEAGADDTSFCAPDDALQKATQPPFLKGQHASFVFWSVLLAFFLLSLVSVLIFLGYKMLQHQAIIAQQHERLDQQQHRIQQMLQGLENLSLQQKAINTVLQEVRVSKNRTTRRVALNNKTASPTTPSTTTPKSDVVKSSVVKSGVTNPSKAPQIKPPSAALQRALSAIRFHGHLFVPDAPKSSFVLANNKAFQEGETISQDSQGNPIKIKKILASGLHVQYRQQTFFLAKETYFPTEPEQ